MIVADTNLITYLFLQSDFSADAMRIFEKDPRWCVPVLWRSEFRNVLATTTRRGLITLGTSKEAMQRAAALLGHAEYHPESDRVLELAAVSGRSAYDCEFIALAEFLRVPLVTNDGPVLRAFSEIAVSFDNFIRRTKFNQEDN